MAPALTGALLGAALLGGCGADEALYRSLTVAPASLTLLGPQHGRALELVATGQDGAPARRDAAELELVTTGGLVELVQGRLRAIAPGAADLVVRAGGAEATLHVEVLDLPPPFATRILGQVRGAGDGFGRDRLPGVVLGAPKGGGAHQGGTDVLSLGVGGSIDLGFDPFVVVDLPGPDLLVFENAFLIASGTGTFAEPARVTVLPDVGDASRTFPCDPTQPPFAGCAGVTPVLAGPGAPEVDPTDPAAAGGDAFDLAALEGAIPVSGVRIEDTATGTVTGTNSGFDLDAVALVHPVPSDVERLELVAPAGAARLELPLSTSTFVPTAALVRADGTRVFGVEAELSLSSAGVAAIDGPFLHPLAPGAATLTARYGPWSAHIDLEVTAR